MNYAAKIERGKISHLQSFYDARATFDFIRQHGDRPEQPQGSADDA